MKRETCLICGNLLKSVDVYCSYCGTLLKPENKFLEKEEILSKYPDWFITEEVTNNQNIQNEPLEEAFSNVINGYVSNSRRGREEVYQVINNLGITRNLVNEEESIKYKIKAVLFGIVGTIIFINLVPLLYGVLSSLILR